MTTRRALAAASIAVALTAVAFASAATHTVKDPKNDLLSTMLPNGVKKADVDIIRATAGKTGTKIEMTLTVDGSIGKAISHTDTPPEFFAKTAGPTYYGIYPTDGRVLDLTHGGQSGSLTMTKPNSHTVSATFKPKAIGNPGSYHWYALVGDCVVYDRAPDTGFAAGKRC
jgi:hypothetical protein